MRTFLHKVHYKILAVRWVGTRLLMHIFTETTTILQFSKYFTGRSEAYYTFEKRQSNGAHIEKKVFRRALRGAAWPLHFKFASYAYVEATQQCLFFVICLLCHIFSSTSFTVLS